VAIVEPPPAIPNGGDIVDAVNLIGWTAGNVVRLLDSAKPLRRAQPVIRVIADIPTIRECGAQAVEYIEEPVLIVGAITAFTGDSGSGKSTLVCKLAGRSGLPVLVLDRENPMAAVSGRLDRLKITEGPIFHYWGGWVGDEAPQPDAEIVVDWVTSCDPKPIIIVDSVVAFQEGDENDAKATRTFMNRCRKLANLGATVVVIHHDGKADSAKDYRGSSDFKAAVDAAFHVTNKSTNGFLLETLHLRCFKSRFGFAGELIYHYADGQFLKDEDHNVAIRRVDQDLADLLRANPFIDAKLFEALATKRGLGRNRARKFLNDGVLAGTVNRESAAKNRRVYCLSGKAEL